jgi:ParB family chromosome partitioning protein
MTQTLQLLTTTARHQKIALGRIASDPQARSHYDEDGIRILAESLIQDGQLEPALVYEDGTRGKFILVAGHRRFLAAQRAGLETLICLVFPEKPTDGDIAKAQVLENSLREALSPIDEANAYRTLMDLEGWTQAQLAEALHISGSTVTRALALLELPESLQEMLKRKGPLKPGHARELARITEGSLRAEVQARIEAEKLTALETAKLVSKLLKPKPKSGRPKSKDKLVFKTLAGYEAVVSPSKVIITPSVKGKPRTPQAMLAALEILVQRYRDEVAKGPAVVAVS